MFCSVYMCIPTQHREDSSGDRKLSSIPHRENSTSLLWTRSTVMGARWSLMLQDVEQKTAEDPHPRSPRRTNRWLFSMSVGVGRGWLKELCITTLTKTNYCLFSTLAGVCLWVVEGMVNPAWVRGCRGCRGWVKDLRTMHSYVWIR